MDVLLRRGTTGKDFMCLTDDMLKEAGITNGMHRMMLLNPQERAAADPCTARVTANTSSKVQQLYDRAPSQLTEQRQLGTLRPHRATSAEQGCLLSRLTSSGVQHGKLSHTLTPPSRLQTAGSRLFTASFDTPLEVQDLNIVRLVAEGEFILVRPAYALTPCAGICAALTRMSVCIACKQGELHHKRTCVLILRSEALHWCRSP